ncbi:hypothetical protein BJV77DRAFT_1066635 [Russula vinacea]|nr:hypothetical protein BJV77DRAFT_1066635 [Russula vinacea]
MTSADDITGEVYQNVTESAGLKDNRHKVVSKASEIVNALLEPASQVANLLDGIGALFPPCKVASNTLAALVRLEVDRRDNDVRIALLFLDFATALANLGTLSPGFQGVTTLTRPLEGLLQRFTSLMKEFGQFCEAYYEAKALKSKLKHLLYSKTNKDSLQDFTNRLVALKNDLIALLSQQAVLMLSAHTDTLSRIESRLAKDHEFYAAVSDASEDSAATFVSSHGGVEKVRTSDELLEELATTVGESLTPSILRAIKEGAEEAFKQSQASFMLKFQFALEQRIDESQEMILNELKSGPYELIHDPDVKEIWKNTVSAVLALPRRVLTPSKAAKESSVKRRQLIDAMNYYFNIQFKKYKAEHHRAEREDSWTRGIISKVHFHPAIGDAIDDDASGYISIEEINEFMRRKPEKWTVPQWVAYWAYGWDADNQLYRERIIKTYTQLQKLRDGQGPHADLVASYLSETEERVTIFAKSLYNMRELDPSAEMKMDRLREELRTRNENELKMRLKSVNHKLDYSVLAAVTGTERIEETFCPLASLLVSRHLWLMSKPDVSPEVVEEATWSILVLLEAMRGRIEELKMIWRRQRMDVDTQIRYYSNGLLEDYYRKYRKEEFDTDLEIFGEESEWGSEDEWTSEDGGPEGGAEDVHIADNTNISSAAESNEPASSRSIPAGGYNTAPREMAPPVRISSNQRRPYDQAQGHAVRGHGSHRDVTHYDEEDEEVEGEADQGEEEDEEVQEHEPEPEPETFEEEEYQGDEPVEDDEEEQGYAHNDEDYEAGELVEGEDDDDGGYGYRAPPPPPRHGRWGR